MKTIVITGATSGIGNLTLKEFAKTDCRIFASYRNPNHIEELKKISNKIIPFYLDFEKPESISAAAEFILGQTSNIDTLINGAGCVIAGPMETIDTQRILKQFEINTFSHLKFTQALFEKLSGAKIINISSTASFGIYPFIAPYCASKRTLDILFTALQLESKNGIKVISIKPGVIKTPLWEKSVTLNEKILATDSKYEKESAFLMKNAQKCAIHGLDAQKVADLIIKVDKMKNPKPSYVIGLDAKLAEITAHLPAGWINFLVKKLLNARCK